MRRSGNRSGKVNEEKEVDIEKSENSADMCFLHKICQREGKAFFSTLLWECRAWIHKAKSEKLGHICAWHC